MLKRIMFLQYQVPRAFLIKIITIAITLLLSAKGLLQIKAVMDSAVLKIIGEVLAYQDMRGI